MHPPAQPVVSTEAGPATVPTEGQAAPKRIRKSRDLDRAIMLRPNDCFELYGISPSSICRFCEHPDPKLRLPSKKVPGRNGRKGMRLILKKDMEEFLERFSAQSEKTG